MLRGEKMRFRYEIMGCEGWFCGPVGMDCVAAAHHLPAARPYVGCTYPLREENLR